MISEFIVSSKPLELKLPIFKKPWLLKLEPSAIGTIDSKSS